MPFIFQSEFFSVSKSMSYGIMYSNMITGNDHYRQCNIYFTFLAFLKVFFYATNTAP